MIVHLLPPWALSDERAGSQYGIVLVDRTNDSTVYGPPDLVDFWRSGEGVQAAAHFVADSESDCRVMNARWRQSS